MVAVASYLWKPTITSLRFSVHGKSSMLPSCSQRSLFALRSIERILKYKYDTNRYSKMSAESKRSCLNLFADIVKNIPPTNVTGYQCKAFYNAAKARIAASTAESYMFTLRSFFNRCVKENLCRRNPVLDVQLDRIDRKGRTRFADFELAQRLIKNAPTDDLRYVLFCGFHAGMRKLEIVAAMPEWFNLSARLIINPDGETRREIACCRCKQFRKLAPTLSSPHTCPRMPVKNSLL